MVSFIIRVLGNSLAIFAATYLVPGFVINGGTKEYLLAGVLLGILNFAVKPILKVISMPLIILTLGLWTIVINALMLWTVDYAFDFVVVQDLTALVWATIIISIVNIFISATTKVVT
ncbi:MAG: phage holin family protein [Candidatus Yanofskybacteria bacterium]|nr:phage holin family protein [Candidatus Yanofskybacteria bacterium]